MLVRSFRSNFSFGFLLSFKRQVCVHLHCVDVAIIAIRWRSFVVAYNELIQCNQPKIGEYGYRFYLPLATVYDADPLQCAKPTIVIYRFEFISEYQKADSRSPKLYAFPLRRFGSIFSCIRPDFLCEPTPGHRVNKPVTVLPDIELEYIPPFESNIF